MRLILLLGLVTTVVQVEAQSLPGRTLLWADEFSQSDGTKPDSSKWGYDIGGSGWGNNELQYYTNRTENARIESGSLVIEARAENFDVKNYTSARLLTKDKGSWTYGRIEARIKIPKGQGIWPAFWMLGANIGSAGWPNCGEIDIMENIGSLPSTLYGTLHGPGYSGGNGISGNTVLSGAALGDDFHVYAIEWEENRIRWFLDGQQFFSLTPANLPAGSAWVFNQPQFLILNVAVGGNWPKNPNESTVFPQRMTVDYVRVYAPAATAPVASTVTVDPAESWLGYMHVADLPASGGTYRSSGTWSVPDLRTSFAGSTLTLSPNTINDPSTYWYIGGGAPGRPGNKIMTRQHVCGKNRQPLREDRHLHRHRLRQHAHQPPTARSPSSGISTPTIPRSRRSPRRSPTVTSLSASPPAPDPAAMCSTGFETTGVNVWPTDVGPFGSVRIAPFTGTPFTSWMSGHDFSAFVNPDLTSIGDPDGDGESNFKEFALNGDPGSAAISGKMRSRIETLVDGQALVLTLPVRGNPLFTGAPGKSGVADQVAYTIEGSNDLAAFNQVVTEIPVISTGMPSLDSGWNYRSFRLDGVIGGSNPRGSSGFLRVRMAESP